MAPNGEMPGQVGSLSGSLYVNPNPVEPKEGVFFSRSELSKRFRYKVPKEEEMENIESGGAALVF